MYRRSVGSDNGGMVENIRRTYNYKTGIGLRYNDGFGLESDCAFVRIMTNNISAYIYTIIVSGAEHHMLSACIITHYYVFLKENPRNELTIFLDIILTKYFRKIGVRKC